MRWLKEGDKDTRFFHAVTAQRRRQNRIEKLEDLEGHAVEGEKEIGDEVINYFQNLFTTSDPQIGEEVLMGMRRSITDAMNVELTKPVEEKEVTKAIFSMNPHKAPCLDGMTLFFKKYWSIIRNDVCMAVKVFF